MEMYIPFAMDSMIPIPPSEETRCSCELTSPLPCPPQPLHLPLMCLRIPSITLTMLRTFFHNYARFLEHLPHAIRFLSRRPPPPIICPDPAYTTIGIWAMIKNVPEEASAGELIDVCITAIEDRLGAYDIDWTENWLLEAHLGWVEQRYGYCAMPLSVDVKNQAVRDLVRDISNGKLNEVGFQYFSVFHCPALTAAHGNLRRRDAKIQRMMPSPSQMEHKECVRGLTRGRSTTKTPSSRSRSARPPFIPPLSPPPTKPRALAYTLSQDARPPPPPRPIFHAPPPPSPIPSCQPSPELSSRPNLLPLTPPTIIQNGRMPGAIVTTHQRALMLVRPRPPLILHVSSPLPPLILSKINPGTRAVRSKSFHPASPSHMPLGPVPVQTRSIPEWGVLPAVGCIPVRRTSGRPKPLHHLRPLLCVDAEDRISFPSASQPTLPGVRWLLGYKDKISESGGSQSAVTEVNRSGSTSGASTVFIVRRAYVNELPALGLDLGAPPQASSHVVQTPFVTSNTHENTGWRKHGLNDDNAFFDTDQRGAKKICTLAPLMGRGTREEPWVLEDD